MTRWWQWATISALALALMGLAATFGMRRTAPVEEKQTIVIYEGSVDAKSVNALMKLIYDNVDKVIGLKLTVDVKDTDRYDSGMDDDRLVITSGNPQDAPEELVVNGVIGSTWAGEYYTVDGFYLIKNGGSHAAGALSTGAEPVDEATIRLNPHIRLVTKKF